MMRRAAPVWSVEHSTLLTRHWSSANCATGRCGDFWESRGGGKTQKITAGNITSSLRCTPCERGGVRTVPLGDCVRRPSLPGDDCSIYLFILEVLEVDILLPRWVANSRRRRQESRRELAKKKKKLAGERKRKMATRLRRMCTSNRTLIVHKQRN